MGKKIHGIDCLFKEDYSLSEYPLTTIKPVKDVLVDGKSVVNKANVAILNCGKAIDSVEKFEDYFYGLEYSEVDYEYAIPKLKEITVSQEFGMCSGFRDGDFFGRSFDWHYDTKGQFFARIAANNGRYASMGIIANIAELTKDVIESGKYVEAYKIAPFRMTDGINEHHLVVSENVVPKGDKGVTTKTVPREEVKCEIPFVAVPRYILDHYKTAYEAVEGIKKNVSIYASTDPRLSTYEIHYFVADEKESYILEIVENEVVYRKVGEGCDYPAIMTNLYVDGAVANEDGTLDDTPENKSLITPLGAGIERHNIAAAHIGTISSKDDMKAVILDKMKYTNLYREETSPIWYSEYVGVDNLTVESPREDFIPWVNGGIELFKKVWPGTRDGSIWYSAHTCIYDIKNRKIYVHIGEGDTEYEFDFKNTIKLK